MKLAVELQDNSRTSTKFPLNHDGSVKVSNEDAERSLDAVFVSAISQGKGNPDEEYWADVDGDERLDLHLAWMRARNAIIEEGMTGGQLAALSRYVTNKALALEEERDSEVKVAVSEKTRGLKARLIATASGLGLLSLVAIAASSMGLSTASVNNEPANTNTTITAEAQPRVTNSFKVGNKTVYTKMVKGKCDAGEVKTKISKKARVQWEWSNGNVSTKVLKKGKVVCAYTNSKGVKSEATYNAAGVMTKLPSTFPKNPTVADIESLGLTKDSKVAPNLRLPQPSGRALAPAKLADTVTPIRAYPMEYPNMVDKGLYNGGFVQEGTKTAIMVEWELRGGSGIVDLGNGTKVPFVNGVARVTGSIGGTEGFPRGQTQGQIMGNGILPDYGQANLPSSTTQNWKIDNAKDVSGIGYPFGVNANSAVIKQGLMDGVVTVFPDYTFR